MREITNLWNVSNDSKNTEKKKLKPSEISSSADVSNMLNEEYSSAERCTAIGFNISIIDQTDASDFIISSNSSKFYFLDDASGKGIRRLI